MRSQTPPPPSQRGEGVRGREVDSALSRIRSKVGSQPNSPALNSTPAIKFAKYLIPAAVIILLLIWLSSCKSPATLTNDTQHRARDSTYHATVHRIETHCTIVIRRPTPSLCREGRGGSPLLRISDRTITLHDTVYICRTDTLIRTQTITVKERYIPPFYRFCTITFATFHINI